MRQPFLLSAMKVYFASATSITNPSPSDKLIQKIIAKKHTLLNGHQEKRDSRFIFEKQRSNIDRADCVIVEITNPSIDVGGIVVYALTKHKPTLALLFENESDRLTPMLAGNPSDALFVDHYSRENLSICLRNFFHHVAVEKKRKGRVIVVDGGDGSGKATQVELLSRYLEQIKANYRIYDFPRYFSSFHGSIIGRMLTGEFGTLDSISPYLASLAYALDRASVKEEMDEFLGKGGVILCNRYATSNMAHQGENITNLKENIKFLNCVNELEYKIHKLPREDIVIYLYVPWQTGLALTMKRAKEKGETMDMAEKDVAHRKSAETMYLSLCKKNAHWVKIDCLGKDKKMRSREDIHKEVVSILKKKKLIP